MATEPGGAASAAPQARPLGTLGAPGALLAPSLALAAAALLLAAREWPLRSRYSGRPFLQLFARDELAGAALLGAIVLLAPLAARGLTERLPQAWQTLPARFGGRRAVAVVAGATALLLAAGACVVYGARPLTMDEYAPWFQARVFAAGHLTGRFPPDLLPRLVPMRLLFPFFAVEPATGAVGSTYWPGFALLLTPFTWLGAPWLLNPLLGAASLVLLASLARRTTGEPAAAGWATLLALASPAFTVNAVSCYPLTAHLALNLAWMALLVERQAAGISAGEGTAALTARPARLVAAGGIGSLALVLANPIPHALFAIPWFAALARRRRWRALSLLALGYAPLATLGVAWLLVRAGIVSGGMPVARAAAGAANPVHGSFATRALELASGAFALPRAELLYARLLGLVELVTWAAPFLPILALFGWRVVRRGSPLRLLASSAILTLVAYCFVPFDQGHGWGYRYFHPAWASLPLLAAAALVDPRWARWRAPVLAAALLSLPAGNALRAAQVHGFVAAQQARLPELPEAATAGGAHRHLRFVSLAGGDSRVDLLQNDPFLRESVITLASAGVASDAALVARRFPGARLVTRSAEGSVWELSSAQ